MADIGNAEFPTVFGPDASFKGELMFEKGLRLHGRFEGKITTPGRLHIAKEARLQADVEAGHILIEGEVHGNMTASDKIELKNSARYEGDLRASRLVVEEGAVFSGHVTVNPEVIKKGAPAQAAQARSGNGPITPQPNAAVLNR